MWKPEGSPVEVNQGQRVILEMTEGLQWNTVTCNNFFTSYALAEELFRQKVACSEEQTRASSATAPDEEQGGPILHLHLTKTHTAVSYLPKQGEMWCPSA